MGLHKNYVNPACRKCFDASARCEFVPGELCK